MAKHFSAKTTVFWDVEDFPNPDGRSIYEIIKSALENEGYHGEVSIRAYGEKKPENLNLDDDGVITFKTKRGKYARLEKMLLEICLASIEYFDSSWRKPQNLVVIAKSIPEEEFFIRELESLHSVANGNVLFVVDSECAPEETSLPDNISQVWFWKSLLDGGKPLERIELDGLLAKAKPPPCITPWEDFLDAVIDDSVVFGGPNCDICKMSW